MSFSFGAKPAQTPAFGTTPTGSITFGTPVAQTTTTTQFGLGTAPFGQSQPGGGFQLGTATPSLFSTPIASVAPTFGTPAVSTVAFGAPKPQVGLFGTPTTTTSTGFSLGGLPNFGTPVSTNVSTGFALGTPTTAGLSFNTQPTQSTGLSFGTPVSTSAGAAPSFAGLNWTPTTTTQSLNFGLAAPPTVTGGLFSTPVTTTSSFLGGLGGSLIKTTTAPLSFATTTISSTQPSVGLGGLTTQQKPATATTNEIPPKEQPLPNEISQNVESFKNFVKLQKSYSSEVARCSAKEFRGVESDIDRVNKLLKEVEAELQKNRAVAEKLKFDTAKGLHNADIAQRTFNTPPGLQYNNVEPMNFFIELADNFEKIIQEMKSQIENTSMYVRSLKQPSSLTPQDLSLGMKRLHETFVALAGRLQSVHNNIEEEKEQYLNFRKHVLHDETNVFEKPTKESNAMYSAMNAVNYSGQKFVTGPTPFNNITTTSYALTNSQNPPPAYPGQAPIGVEEQQQLTVQPELSTAPGPLPGSSIAQHPSPGPSSAQKTLPGPPTTKRDD